MTYSFDFRFEWWDCFKKTNIVEIINMFGINLIGQFNYVNQVSNYKVVYVK